MKCDDCPLATCVGERPGFQFACKMAVGTPAERRWVEDQSAVPVVEINPPSVVGLWRKLKNLTGAVIVQARAGNPKASPEVQQERKAICDGCEHLQGNTCHLCGCGLDLKRSWATSSCPDKRWSAVEPPSAVEDLEQGVGSSSVEIPA